MIKQSAINLYRFIFCRKLFYRFNYHVYKLSLRGIGVLNSEGNNITGETNFFKLLKKKIPINVIVDVGANNGGYSQEIRSFFPHAKIYAFEPHPKTFLQLKKLAAIENIKAYNKALGRKKGTVTLWDFADDAELKHMQPTSPLSSIYKEVIENLHKQKSTQHTVKMTTLDDFIQKEKINSIDLLKIDTEGNEYDVLLGAAKLIKMSSIKIIQFEFNEMNVYSRTYLNDFIALLPKYNFYRLMPWGLLPIKNYRPLTHEIFAFQNIAAIYKEIDLNF